MVKTANHDQIKRDLLHKVEEHYRQEGSMRVESVVVHPGPIAWKTVSLLTFIDDETGEIRRRRFRTQTWKAIPPEGGGGYDFAQAQYRWECADEEVEAVREFLNGSFTEPGKYRLVKRGSELDDLLQQLERQELTSADALKLIQAAGHTPDIISVLAASSSGALLAEAVELQRRCDQLAELRRIVDDPSSTERDNIHPQLKEMGWIFGGRYVGESTRRQLTVGDQLDIPLLRADGSLHIVELKGANIPRLIRRYRGPNEPAATPMGQEEVPLIVGPDVNEAVGQAMNYLCRLDESRDHILTRFKIDTRRATATVLVGHPDFVQGDFTPEDIASTLRIYNSHLSRIEVMHYDDLIKNVERALAMTGHLSEGNVEDQQDRQSEDDEAEAPSPAGDDPWARIASEPWPDDDDPF